MILTGPSLSIANAGTQSNPLQLDQGVLAGLIFPAAFTGATVSFEVSLDGGVTWYAVAKADGSAYTVTVALGKCVVIPPDDMANVGFVRIIASAQAADRQIITIIRY